MRNLACVADIEEETVDMRIQFFRVGTRLASALLFIAVASFAEVASAAQSVDAQAWAKQAEEAFRQGDFSKAAKGYEKAVKNDVENPVYLEGLGRAYEREAEQSAFPIFLTRKARVNLQRALRIDPNNVAALQDLADLEQQPIGLCEGNLSQASMLIEHLETIDPEAAAREQWLLADAVKQEKRPGQLVLCGPVRLTRVITDPILNPRRSLLTTIPSAPDSIVSQNSQANSLTQGQ